MCELQSRSSTDECHDLVTLQPNRKEYENCDYLKTVGGYGWA